MPAGRVGLDMRRIDCVGDVSSVVLGESESELSNEWCKNTR